MIKNYNFKVLLMLVIFLIYFFSTILANYFQHYEYIFSDINNIKKYQLFSSRVSFYAYIDLEDGMYPEGQVGDFRIKEVYEDKNYFIGYDFENNYKTNKIEKRYYIVIDKNKATMKITSEAICKYVIFILLIRLSRNTAQLNAAIIRDGF